MLDDYLKYNNQTVTLLDMILQIYFMYFACGNYCTAIFLSKNIAQNKLKKEQERNKSLKKKEAFENYP